MGEKLEDGARYFLFLEDFVDPEGFGWWDERERGNWYLKEGGGLFFWNIFFWKNFFFGCWW